MIISVFIPIMVVLLMLIVGTGLRGEQFQAVLRDPKALIGGTLAQIILLPIGALIIIFLLKPTPELAAGLILVAACPGGALSNFYCHMIRLNVPLSVMLTASSSILSFFTLPLILMFSFPFISSTWQQEIPTLQLIKQLFLLLLLPIGIGMLLRYFFSNLVERYGRQIRKLSLLLLVLLLATIVISQWQYVLQQSLGAAVLVASFTGFALLSAWLTASLLNLPIYDRLVFMIEFSVRNVAAAALVAAIALGKSELIAFGALFIIYQLPLIALLLWLYQSKRLSFSKSGKLSE